MLEVMTLDYSQVQVPINFWDTGDWHLGSVNFAETLFYRHYGRAVDGKWVLLHVGDGLEMTTPSSKVMHAGAMREQVLLPEQQRQSLVQLLRGIHDGVILMGNHEQRVDNATGLNFMAMVTEAKGVNIKPLSLPGIVKILVGSQTYYVLLHHGEGPGTNPLTLANRLQEIVEGMDLVLTGHIHCSTLDPRQVMTVNGPREIMRLRAGHYLNYPAYAMRKPTSPPAPPGSWLMTLDPNEHSLKYERLSE